MKYKFPVVLLSTTLLLSACGDNDDKVESPDDKNKTEVNSSETNKSDDVKNKKDDNVAKENNDDNQKDKNHALVKKEITATSDDIIKIMHDEKHNGKLTGIEFEYENEWVYKVSQIEDNKVVVYTYSMDDRKMLNSKEESIDSEEDKPFKYEELVSAEEAIDKTIDKSGKEAKIKEWSLNTDDGMLVYNITLDENGKEREFNVDPHEGLVNEEND